MVSTVVAKGEDKIDVSVYNDPYAGTLDSGDVHIVEKAEAELAKDIEATQKS